MAAQSADKGEPLLVVHTHRQELRAAGLLALPVIIFSLAGFVPSWLQFFTVGQLHLDPWFEVGLPIAVPWSILQSHAEMATLWGILAIAQTLLGMGLLPQIPSQVHRVLGYFLIFLGVLAFGSGSLLEILEYGGCPTWLHLLGGVMIFLHFGLLLHFARAKQRKEHAFAVLSMLVWTLYPGWARIVGFSIELHFGIPCGLHAWAGYEFIAASSCALALLLLALREYRISGMQVAAQRPSLNAPSVLLMSSMVFSAYAAIDLIHACLSHAFLRCPG